MRAVKKGDGEKCPNCSKIMERRTHKEIPEKKEYRVLYYSEWDYCESCHHVQHYERFKTFF